MQPCPGRGGWLWKQIAAPRPGPPEYQHWQSPQCEDPVGRTPGTCPLAALFKAVFFLKLRNPRPRWGGRNCPAGQSLKWVLLSLPFPVGNVAPASPPPCTLPAAADSKRGNIGPGQRLQAQGWFRRSCLAAQDWGWRSWLPWRRGAQGFHPQSPLPPLSSPLRCRLPAATAAFQTKIQCFTETSKNQANTPLFAQTIK